MGLIPIHSQKAWLPNANLLACHIPNHARVISSQSSLGLWGPIVFFPPPASTQEPPIISKMSDSEAREHPCSRNHHSPPSHFLICNEGTEPGRQRGQSGQTMTWRRQDKNPGWASLASPGTLDSRIRSPFLRWGTEEHRHSIPWAQSVG